MLKSKVWRYAQKQGLIDIGLIGFFYFTHANPVRLSTKHRNIK